MTRYTYETNEGVRWSPHRKEELVNQLAAYEDTGLTPAEVMALKRGAGDDGKGTQSESKGMA